MATERTWEISDIDGSNKRRVTLAQYRAELDAAKNRALAIYHTRRHFDRGTAEHFYAWLTAQVADDEQSTVEDKIHRLHRDHPDLINTHSWPEMRQLAERNY